MSGAERTADFTLAAHQGPYESWPARSRLSFQGRETGAELDGYVIEAQFRMADRYLVVTSFDCPYEERTVFHLLDERFRVLSRTGKGAPYCTWLLDSIEPAVPGIFDVRFHPDDRFVLRVRDRRPLGVGSYLDLRPASAST